MLPSSSKRTLPTADDVESPLSASAMYPCLLAEKSGKMNVFCNECVPLLGTYLYLYLVSLYVPPSRSS